VVREFREVRELFSVVLGISADTYIYNIYVKIKERPAIR
jgi:hypothetical protein